MNLHNATQRNRFSVVDVVDADGEPDPFTPDSARRSETTPSSEPAAYCRSCGGGLRAGDRFCSRCGKQVD